MSLDNLFSKEEQALEKARAVLHNAGAGAPFFLLLVQVQHSLTGTKGNMPRPGSIHDIRWAVLMKWSHLFVLASVSW